MPSKKKKKKEKKVDHIPDPICDWHGTCGKKAFAEVYPIDIKSTIQNDILTFSEHGWSYLCFWHFVIATLRGNPIVWTEVNEEGVTRFQNIIISLLDIVVKFYTSVRKLRYFIEEFLNLSKKYDNYFITKLNDKQKKVK